MPKRREDLLDRALVLVTIETGKNGKFSTVSLGKDVVTLARAIRQNSSVPSERMTWLLIIPRKSDCLVDISTTDYLSYVWRVKIAYNGESVTANVSAVDAEMLGYKMI
jgi:hypothetical protein